MMKHWLASLATAVFAMSPVVVHAATLTQDSPTAKQYVAELDFFQAGPGDGLGSATGFLQAVDLALPPGPVNTSTSGCEAADFAGFVAGNIALMQRGSCLFEQKVNNAFLAGAIGALIFNEGQVGRTDAIGWNCSAGLGTRCEIPSLFVSFAVGDELAGLLANGPVQISMTVPEPGTLALVALGLVGATRLRRRQPG